MVNTTNKKDVIYVSPELWKLVHNDKINSSETMEDVLWRWKNLLDEQITIKQNFQANLEFPIHSNNTSERRIDNNGN